MNNIFYTPSSRITDDRIELTGQEAHHAARVLRFSQGEDLVVVDGEGGFYEGPIVQVNQQSVVARLKNSWQEDPPKPNIAVGMAIIKKRDRLEFAIEKAVEMGVSSFYLFPTRHTEKNKVRTKRLETIALGAMKQSLRSYKPEIEVAGGLNEALKDLSDQELLVAYQDGDPLNDKLDQLTRENRLSLLIGPEGGWSDQELNTIKAKGGQALSLGNKRLRAETAAIKMVSKLT